MLPHPNKVNIDIKTTSFPSFLWFFTIILLFLTLQFFKDFEKKYKVITKKTEDNQIAFPKKNLPKKY